MGAFIKGFVLGGLVGAGVALFMAPQSGEETRAQLKDKGLHYKDVAEEGVLVARERGIEALEKGKVNAS
jgi:gas vesicle protein